MNKHKIINCLFILSIIFFSHAQENQKLDFLIKNATVFDGSRNEPQKLDIGIYGDRITYISSHSKSVSANQVIDAEGLYISPGFIDPHTHNDKWLNSDNTGERENLPSLLQGVTTVFLGSDGFGGYNIGDKIKHYNQSGVGTNIALFVGFSPVRKKVIGTEDIKASKEDIKAMKELIVKGMQEGAFGLSTGLYYSPQSYASTKEVIELAKEVRKYGGLYDTHMRSESNGLIEAIKENIKIGRQADIPVMISHIKALGPAAWGKSDEVIRLIENAQKEGVEIFASQYPYIASQTSLKAMLLPQWVQSGGKSAVLERLRHYGSDKKLKKDISKNLAIRGGDSRIVISRYPDSAFIGKSLHEIATQWNVSPEEAAVEIIQEAYNTSAISFSMDPEDIDNFMTKPWVITGSDGGGGHPRTYGTFVRKIRKYTLEDHVLSLVDAIHQSTGKSAKLLGIKDRGFIKKDFFADLVIFDLETVQDNATFEKPDTAASGIQYVFVNGSLSVKNGKPTGKLSGRALKK